MGNPSLVIRVFHGRVRGLAALTNVHSPSIMAAARPAWEQALVNNHGVPRYQNWGFDDVIDPRATMRGVAGMAWPMAFFRDHASVDRAVIAWANYARAIDAEFSLVIAQVAANTITEVWFFLPL